MSTAQIRSLANDLDVRTVDILPLIDQLVDEPELWNSHTELLTTAGVDLIREQVAGAQATDAAAAALDDVRASSEAVEDAARAVRAAQDARDAAILEAARVGAKKTAIADTAGLSRERVYQVLGR